MAMSRGYNGGLLPNYEDIWVACASGTVSLEDRVTGLAGVREKGEKGSVGCRSAQGARRPPSSSLTFACLQGPGPKPAAKRKAATPPAKGPVQKRKVSLPTSAGAGGGKGKGGASATQTPGELYSNLGG